MTDTTEALYQAANAAFLAKANGQAKPAPAPAPPLAPAPTLSFITPEMGAAMADSIERFMNRRTMERFEELMALTRRPIGPRR